MLHERKKLSIKSDNLYSNRGRNVTPPKYTNAKTNYTASPISYKTKEMTSTNRSRSKGKMYLGDEGSSNERQEELYQKVMQEKDYSKVAFQDLLYCICDFQMLQHEKYLYRFVSLFKSADLDKDGIINEDQFRYLIREMKIIPPTVATSEEKLEEEIDRLLMMLDPHKTQQITFSELVTFLTLTEFNEASANKDLNLSGDPSRTADMGEDKREDGKLESVSNMSLTLLDKINEMHQ